MSERYSKLYSLPENLYAEGSPLIIAAGSLLKDNQTGNVLAQIKFKSLADKKVSAIMVKIKAFDVTGKELKGVEEHQYLDLNVVRNQVFGQKSPIMLPENVTRSFECEVKAIIFSDGTNKQLNEVNREALPTQELLRDKLGELREQYIRDTRCKGQFCPVEHKDLWLCNCGVANKIGEEKCYACGRDKTMLYSAFDKDLLTEHKTAYEAALKKKAAAEAMETQRQKSIIIKSISIIISAIVLIAALLVIMTDVNYRKALKAYKDGRYEEAISTFEALGEYKDSKEQVENCNNAILNMLYNNAMQKYNEGKYEEAISAFEELHGYKESELYIKKSKFGIAVLLFNEGKYKEAEKGFSDLESFSDSDIWEKKSSGKINIQNIKNSEIGDTITFGEYDNMELKWKIICKENNKILVLYDATSYVFRGRTYGLKKGNNENATWANSGIREELQQNLLEWFSETEQEVILSTKTTNPLMDEDGSVKQQETEDKLFLLSAEEIEKYLPNKASRVFQKQTNNRDKLAWWLRGSADKEGRVNAVKSDGDIGSYTVESGIYCRPAMWITLE